MAKCCGKPISCGRYIIGRNGLIRVLCAVCRAAGCTHH